MACLQTGLMMQARGVTPGDSRNWPQAADRKKGEEKRRLRLERWPGAGQKWRFTPQQQAHSKIGPMTGIGLALPFSALADHQSAASIARLEQEGEPERASLAARETALSSQ